MRHAKTEEGEFGMSDFDRKLTEKGKQDAIKAAKELKKEISNIDLIIASSAKRTVKTAQIVAEKFIINAEAITITNYLYEAEIAAYISTIKNIDDSINSTLIVGHNPTIAAMAMVLSGHKVNKFKPGSFVVFNLPIDNWKKFNIEASELALSFTP